MCKSSVYFNAPPHFRLVHPHFVCSDDGTDDMAAKIEFLQLREDARHETDFTRENTGKF